MNYTGVDFLYAIFLQHRNIQTDTRKLQKGDIFFALKGENFDANAFAAQALEQGASYAVIDDAQYQKGDRYLLVENVLHTLQQLAALHRQKANARILAITGTNGKTTTKEIIAAVLGKEYRIIYTEGNLNNHIGVPLTLLRIGEDTEIAVIEMGANHIGEIASYCEWAKPDYGIITNVGKAHLEGFGSLEGVQQAKGELYQSIARQGKLIFQYKDAPFLHEMTPEHVSVMTYGSSNADICGKVADTSSVTLNAEVTYPEDIAGLYPSQLVGGYNLPNILCAITVGMFFNIGLEHIRAAIQEYIPSNSRSQLLKKGTNTIILDAYNANPTSLGLALENLSRLTSESKWVLMGAMKEMGSNSDAEHAHIVDLARKLGLDQMLLVGQEFEKAGIQDTPIFSTSEELREYLLRHPIENATILIKGSRGSKMEAVLPAFEQ